MHCILKSKIKFIGQVGYEYFHIQIKNAGFIIEKMEKMEARDFIEEKEIPLVCTNEYGEVYATDDFKPFMDAHPKMKKTIYYLLDEKQ